MEVPKIKYFRSFENGHVTSRRNSAFTSIHRSDSLHSGVGRGDDMGTTQVGRLRKVGSQRAVLGGADTEFALLPSKQEAKQQNKGEGNS